MNDFYSARRIAKEAAADAKAAEDAKVAKRAEARAAAAAKAAAEESDKRQARLGSILKK